MIKLLKFYKEYKEYHIRLINVVTMEHITKSITLWIPGVKT